MSIVTRALAERAAQGHPIRVGIVGAGSFARGVGVQILTAVTGMELVAVANRRPEPAEAIFAAAGAAAPERVDSIAELERVIASGRAAFTEDPLLLAQAEGIDAVVEGTGTVELAARVVDAALAHGKHAVVNAELSGTVGPILAERARRAGVVITDADGDQPGAIMDLYRFVQDIGCRPVLAGNIKGLEDPYRDPTTQEEFARRNHLTPQMAASFADGSKISFEMASVANATGFRVGARGMYGPTCAHVDEAVGLFPLDELLDGGLVDYVLGAEPGGGVFVLGHQDDPLQRKYLELYKMGEGPIYCFHRPFHLAHFEAPLSIARAVLFGEAVVAPAGGPVAEVVALAKRDLAAGTELDGIGWYTHYGQLDNHSTARAEDLLPQGLAEGSVLKRDVRRDAPITFADVELPPDRLSESLWREQVGVQASS